MKTLVVTEKKSVADDFARVLGGFKKQAQSYESDDMIVAWASGHLLELQAPANYDPKYKRWLIQDLPIIPESFVRNPRTGNARTKELLTNLVKLMRRKDVDCVINACDAGREGELIFNLIADHAGISGRNGKRTHAKEIKRLWLQSMTSGAIRQAFEDLHPSEDFANLRTAAYARDEADWMVGMNGTRAFTRKFMGRARAFFAVGRVKTPTLAFLVDREMEIDRFRPEPYFQVDASFVAGDSSWRGRWTGRDEAGKRTDRLAKREQAQAVIDKVTGQSGTAIDKTTRRTEMPPLLFDLTSLQREASSRFGFTLDRTLRVAQSLYEARKAITYPRTSSRYLPQDYAQEVPGLVASLEKGPLSDAVAAALRTVGGPVDSLKPVRPQRVFNDKKVSDHFALIPTGEAPGSLKADEEKIYSMIVRRFLAVLMPDAKWSNVTRTTTVAGEEFISRERRLDQPGWRAVEPVAGLKELPELPEGGSVSTTEVELLEKETQAPPRFTDGSLVKAMETAGKDIDHPDEADGTGGLDEDVLEELKEKGIGTPATRAAIVKDLIDKGLARRQGRNLLPTPKGCNLVRIVRNLGLDVLAKPDLTGEWEYRLAQMADGTHQRDDWDRAIRQQVAEIVAAVKEQEGGSETVFKRDHPAPLEYPGCDEPMVEKTFSYMCQCGEIDVNISKDQRGKYVFPMTMLELIEKGRVGPLTGFDGTKARGYLVLTDDHRIEVELEALADGDEEEETPGEFQREEVPEGLEVGVCPKCGDKVTRQGRGYKCVQNIPRKKDKLCDFRIAERIKYRYLPLDEIRKLLSGQKTDQLFGFVSMRGKKFKASLYYDEQGELKWEFPPRKTKKKTTKKKASKKKSTKKKASKKSTRKKTAARKTSNKKVTNEA